MVRGRLRLLRAGREVLAAAEGLWATRAEVAARLKELLAEQDSGLEADARYNRPPGKFRLGRRRSPRAVGQNRRAELRCPQADRRDDRQYRATEAVCSGRAPRADGLG
jgi:hypothetical protein